MASQRSSTSAFRYGLNQRPQDHPSRRTWQVYNPLGSYPRRLVLVLFIVIASAECFERDANADSMLARASLPGQRSWLRGAAEDAPLVVTCNLSLRTAPQLAAIWSRPRSRALCAHAAVSRLELRARQIHWREATGRLKFGTPLSVDFVADGQMKARNLALDRAHGLASAGERLDVTLRGWDKPSDHAPVWIELAAGAHAS
jgi:hypothetical protein